MGSSAEGFKRVNGSSPDLIQGIGAVFVGPQLQWDEIPRGQQRIMEDGLPTLKRDSRPDWGGYLEQHRTDTWADEADSASSSI